MVTKMADDQTQVSQYRTGEGEQPQGEACRECGPIGENEMNGKSRDECDADKENSVDHNLTAAARDLPPVVSKLPKSAMHSADQTSSSRPVSSIKSDRLRDLPR